MILPKKKITVIGGGTGTMAVLSGLKDFTDLELKVVVSMTDDGGSNAVIRDEFGLLPLSDARKSIIALARSSNQLLREIFTYRFAQGQGLQGHTLGNLIMLGLTDLRGSEVEAIKAASQLFFLRGEVIPVTIEKTTLEAEYDDGELVTSEHLIDEPKIVSDRKIVSLRVAPRVRAYDVAVRAIIDADFIVAGPGDLYTTTLANVVVDGIAEAIQKSQAKLLFVNNLMTKNGQTHWMKATDLVNEIIKYFGRVPDVVITHQGDIEVEILAKYREKGEFPIEDNLPSNADYKIIRDNFMSGIETILDRGDVLDRSLIRHDAQKLAKVLCDCFNGAI